MRICSGIRLYSNSSTRNAGFDTTAHLRRPKLPWSPCGCCYASRIADRHSGPSQPSGSTGHGADPDLVSQALLDTAHPVGAIGYIELDCRVPRQSSAKLAFGGQRLWRTDAFDLRLHPDSTIVSVKIVPPDIVPYYSDDCGREFIGLFAAALFILGRCCPCRNFRFTIDGRLVGGGTLFRRAFFRTACGGRKRRGRATRVRRFDSRCRTR